jgi:NAD(P)-dependent dehydrogenase (short-subunit alcohol dehydrogenase family)
MTTMERERRMHDLGGQVAIVIGGSRGIGRAIALGLAENGAHVVVASRSAAAVDSVAAEIAALGGRADGMPMDVSRLEDIERLVGEVRSRFGRIDVLVNNAGINPMFKRPEAVTHEDWDLIMSVNLRGAFLACREVGKVMIAQHGGRIVNISSATALSGTKRGLPYTAAKAGLIAMTQTLAADWCSHGIRVNAIAPGYVITDLTSGLMKNAEIYRRVLEKIPMGRFADPEEIVEMTLYLSSGASSYVTGQVFVVDGGYAAIR